MVCNDCGHKIESWHEYCSRCGAELYKKHHWDATKKHPVFSRLYGHDRID